MDSDKTRTHYGMIGGAAGIGVNALIFILEIFIGLLTHSVAITADAFHNLTDVASSVITIISFKLAGKPADRKHPFGHGRMEYISSLLISMLILVIGIEFIRSSFEKILHPTAVHFSWVAFILILCFIPAKLLLSLFYRHLGKRINSDALQATAFDALSDVLVLIIASMSLLLTCVTTIPIDGWLGIFVSVFILYSGISIAKKALDSLLGKAPDPAIVQEIVQDVLSYPYITGVHDLIVHNYGPNKFMATLHAEVPSDVPVMDLHESIDRAEREVSEQHGILLVLHMDPLNKNDTAVVSAQKELMKAIQPIAGIQSIHDFRIVGAGEHINLIFDVVVDDRIAATPESSSHLTEQINQAIQKIHPGYHAVVQIDRNYISL